MILSYIRAKIKRFIVNKRFQARTNNCKVFIAGETKEERVSVGKYTYGPINALFFDSDSLLKIGNFCSIAPSVTFIVSADHYLNHISTYPFKVKITNTTNYEAITKGDIIVEDDVWIGYGTTIMSGVHIGQGAVIAAGAVVTKNVPPYAIVGGVPAKIIKYRFSSEIIEELLKVDYSKLTEDLIGSHIDELYTELKDVRQLAWLPKRQLFVYTEGSNPNRQSEHGYPKEV